MKTLLLSLFNIINLARFSRSRHGMSAARLCSIDVVFYEYDEKQCGEASLLISHELILNRMSWMNRQETIASIDMVFGKRKLTPFS